MNLKLHNTLTGRKEPFEPLDANCVTMYVCGPTVYNLVHIGNGRPAVVFDVLYRLLAATYPKVRYASNITDIDSMPDDQIEVAIMAFVRQEHTAAIPALTALKERIATTEMDAEERAELAAFAQEGIDLLQPR